MATRDVPQVVVSNVPTSTLRYATVKWYEDSEPEEDGETLQGNGVGSLGVSLASSRRSSVTSCSISDSDEFETDLEDVPDIIRAADIIETDPNPEVGEVTYRMSCKDISATPQTSIQAGLSQARLLVASRNMGDRQVIPLARTLKLNNRISELDLSGNSISYPGMTELSQALRANTTIKTLNLSNNNLGVSGAIVLAEMMQNNGGVKMLDISDNRFNDEAAKFLAIGIEATVTIENLNLSHNLFGEEGGLHIGVGLQKNESIRRLNICWNCLRMTGAVKVMQGIQENMMTTHVDVSHNGFGYEGALAVQHLLSESIYITDIDLTANRMDWRCALLIADGIANNNNLEILRVGKNPLTTTGAMDLIDAASAETCGLRVLDLTDVPVTREFVMIAQTIIEMREFSYNHGGVVNSHDFLGRRDTNKRTDPMQKLKDFMRDWGIRPNELFRIINKSGQIELSPAEFIQRLKTVGVPVTEKELEDITKRIGEETSRDGISFKELLSGIRTHERRERRTKMRARDQQILMDMYHDRILNPELPPLYEEGTDKNKPITDVEKKFRYLLMEQVNNTSTLPPIDLAASYSGAGGGAGANHLDLLASINSAGIPGSARGHQPKIMSMTRPIGAKTKGFGENYRKKKKGHGKKSGKAKKK